MNYSSIILDISVIFIAVLAAYVGWENGFSKALISFLGFFVSLFGCWILTPHLAEAILAQVTRFLNGQGVTGQTASEITAEIISRVLAFALIFIAISILVAIIKAVARKLFEFPVLKQADRLVGMLLGIASGYFALSVLCLVLFTASGVITEVVDFINPSTFEDSLVARWIYEHNILGFILKLAE